MVELCNFKQIVFKLEVYGELHYRPEQLIDLIMIIRYADNNRDVN